MTKLPAAVFTVVTGGVILWLTLAPKPLGDDPPKLFPGADKVVHAMMFGFLEAMMLLDWQRIHNWQKATWAMATLYATAVSFFGIFIECAQSYMGLGRGFEVGDIIADTVGPFLIASIWIPLQKYWLPITPK